jgi:hypothetical protein
LATDKQEQALTLYQQASALLAEGKLIEAEALAKQATDYVIADGTIITNQRNLFLYHRVGRKTQLESESVGDENVYAPNVLLAQIAQHKALILAQSRARMKRLAPPVLALRDISVIDEDRDGILAALEHGTLRFTLTNTGQSRAEDLKFSIDAHDLDLAITGLTLKRNSLDPGQSLTHTVNFSIPQQVRTAQANLVLRVGEKDGLGEVLGEPVVLSLRSYFAPILHIDHVASLSQPILPHVPATQVFTLTNRGMQTAFDVALSLDFAYADRVRVIDDLDITSIRQLKPNESRTFSFTVEPTATAKVGQGLGIQLLHLARGRKQQRISTDLFLSHSSQMASRSSNQLLAAVNSFTFARQAKTPSNAVALIMDFSRQNLAQPKNSGFMQQFLQQDAGLKASNILLLKPLEANATEVLHLLDQPLQQRIAAAKPDLLWVYVVATGEFNQANQEASVQSLVGEQTSNLSVSALLEAIAQLSLLPTVVVIESNFRYRGQAAGVEHAPWAYLSQALVPKIPANMQVLFATQAGQATTAIPRLQTGSFTFAVVEQLQQALHRQPLSAALVSQTMASISQRCQQLSEALYHYQQRPLLLAN